MVSMEGERERIYDLQVLRGFSLSNPMLASTWLLIGQETVWCCPPEAPLPVITTGLQRFCKLPSSAPFAGSSMLEVLRCSHSGPVFPPMASNYYLNINNSQISVTAQLSHLKSKPNTYWDFSNAMQKNLKLDPLPRSPDSAIVPPRMWYPCQELRKPPQFLPFPQPVLFIQP